MTIYSSKRAARFLTDLLADLDALANARRDESDPRASSDRDLAQRLQVNAAALAWEFQRLAEQWADLADRQVPDPADCMSEENPF